MAEAVEIIGFRNLEIPAYPGCHGPHAEYIKLISEDKFEFYAKKSLLLQSKMLKSLLSTLEKKIAQNDLLQIELGGIR